MRISDWSSDVCSSDLHDRPVADRRGYGGRRAFRVSRHGARGYTARAARNNGFARYGTNGGHGMLRLPGGSGKGRWMARRPIGPRMIEVDVTDKIAEGAPPEREAR